MKKIQKQYRIIFGIKGKRKKIMQTAIQNQTGKEKLNARYDLEYYKKVFVLNKVSL